MLDDVHSCKQQGVLPPSGLLAPPRLKPAAGGRAPSGASSALSRCWKSTIDRLTIHLFITQTQASAIERSSSRGACSGQGHQSRRPGARRFPDSSSMATMDDISLRPLSLRPGAGSSANPFAGFAKGAGVGLKIKVRWVLAMVRLPRRQPCCRPGDGIHSGCGFPAGPLHQRARGAQEEAAWRGYQVPARVPDEVCPGAPHRSPPAAGVSRHVAHRWSVLTMAVL